MRTFFLGIGYLITIGLYISFSLLPYYIAYSFIEPESFFGVVGVFILGSVIVPLVIWGITLIVGTIGLSFSALAERKAKNNYQEIKTINEVSPKSNSKIIFILGFFLVISIGVIIYLITFQQKSDESNYYTEDFSAASDAVEAANEVIEATDDASDNDQEYYSIENDSVSFNNNVNENTVDQTGSSNLDLPNLQTLGPSHLSLNVWFKDAEGSSFDIEFKNSKRPEINSTGSCSNVKSDLEQTSRFSNLINKELNIHSIYECDNNMTVEASTFTEDNESHFIMTLSQTDNLNRIFYSGEMTKP